MNSNIEKSDKPSCIKISEHFADGGKQMDELVEDAVCHHAGRDSSAPAFLNAV